MKNYSDMEVCEVIGGDGESHTGSGSFFLQFLFLTRTPQSHLAAFL